jgi:hypothetical protein
MYRSVGKFSVSDTITRRPGSILSAAASTLNKLIEVDSATTTSPASAPMSRAILSPTRSGIPIQS